MVTELPAYILAGGESRRFGSDKARALLFGEPLILQVAQTLARRVRSITVVAERDDEYADLGLRTIGDREPGHGPVGGLARALADLDGDGWLLLVSCDLVGLEAAWLDALWQARVDGAEVVAFRGERWQPFPALYHRSLLTRARERLARGPRSLWRLIAASEVVELPIPPGWSAVVQVNTPDDLAEVAALQSESRRRRDAG